MTVKGGFALAAALAHGALAASTTTSAALTTSSPVLPASATDTCPTKFIRPSAYEWVRNAQPGWNLGNTLEAIPTEGSWNNPPVVPSTFDYVKEAGIKAVRIPGMLKAQLQAATAVKDGEPHMLTLITSYLRRPFHLWLTGLDYQRHMA